MFYNDLIYQGGGRFTKLPITPQNQADMEPMSLEEKRRRNLEQSLNVFGILRKGQDQIPLSVDPEYDYIARGERYAHNAAKYRAQAVAQRTKNRNIALANSTVHLPNIVLRGGGGRPKGDFGSFLSAIAGKESGGNYGAVNKDSGAMGKYQIMPSNIAGPGGWDQQTIGRDISTQQFMNNPRLQEKIARRMLRNYYNKYGPAGAASAWYSGDPNKYKYSKGAEGNYPSVAKYVQAILNAMGK